MAAVLLLLAHARHGPLDTSVEDPQLRSPLHLAAELAHVVITQLLLWVRERRGREREPGGGLRAVGWVVCGWRSPGWCVVTRPFILAVRRRRGGPRCAGPHGTVLCPPGWQPAVCRHPPPARLPWRGRQHSHHAQRGHHPQHYRHAQPEAPEQRCQLGPRGHHDRAGIVAQQRERHPPPPRGPGTTTPGGPLDRCTHSPLQSRPTGALSTPTRAQPRTPPRRHELTSLSPARHGDPSSSRPYFTASLLGWPWLYLLGVCRWALPCSSRPLGAGKRSSPACVLQSGGGSRDPGWLLGQRHARGRG